MVQHTLNSIVREFLIEKGDSNTNRFARMFQIATSGLRELAYDTSGTPTSVLIPIRCQNNQTQSQISENAPPQNSNIVEPNQSLVEGDQLFTYEVVPLPNNYVQLIRIAAIDAFGNLQALGMNTELELPRFHNACGREMEVPQNNNLNSSAIGGQIFWSNLDGYADFFRNAEATGRNFGLGGGNNVFGSYRIDLERGTIVLTGVNSGVKFLMLEYLADITEIDGKYMVHPFIIEALKTWMQYGDIRFNPRVGLGEKQMAKHEFDLAEKQARRRFNSHNFQDYLQAFRLSNKVAPKF